MRFQIRYALSGGFGGADMADWEDAFSETLEDAQNEAYQNACDLFDGYAGLHGLRDVGDIMEEDEIEDEEEAYEVYVEERENWLDYEVREWQEEEID